MATVFDRIREDGLKLKPTKCQFLQDQVQYLGHIVTREGIAADPSKTAVIKEWPVPTCTKEVQCFLGFAGYYRRFVHRFPELARPLHRLTEKNQPFKWSDECQAAFEHLKKYLLSPPILIYPQFYRMFILDTDASNEGVGAVLSQVGEDGRELVVAYGSRLLTKAERKYCVTRRNYWLL